MNFDVILFKQAGDGFIARPVFWPDEAAYGATEQEALNRVRELIRGLVNRTRFVQVEVDIPPEATENPWLTKAGMFTDDPTWDNFLETMAGYRQQLEEMRV
jgi:predicted RNase H-like HicB family nuclease